MWGTLADLVGTGEVATRMDEVCTYVPCADNVIGWPVRQATVENKAAYSIRLFFKDD